MVGYCRPTVTEEIEFDYSFEAINFVKSLFQNQESKKKIEEYFPTRNPVALESSSNNSEARRKSDIFYIQSSKLSKASFHGANNTDTPILSNNENEHYIFPPQCKFFSYDVHEIENRKNFLETDYDLILLDPPWWNKYIRRKKKKNSEATYGMMYNEDIAKIPIRSLITPGSLVAVWCTNSESNFNALTQEIFPKWGVEFIGTWYWLKVTSHGEPVCPFTIPPGKQPFEKIVFGYCSNNNRILPLPENGRIIISVPSAIHSHKPPLSEVLASYLPLKPKCLELFARYLLPGWTSWGNEVLKLQHLSLYIVKDTPVEQSVLDNDKIDVVSAS